MSFTVEASNLRRAVERMKPAQTAQTAWAAKFSWADDELSLQTVGYNLSAIATVPAEAREIGVADLPLGKLHAWLSVTNGEVTVEPDGDLVWFTTPDAELQVPTYDAELAQVPTCLDGAPVLPDEAWEAVQRVAFAAEPMMAQTSPGMKNMLHVQGEHVWATDGYSYAQIRLPGNHASVSFYPELAGVLRLLDNPVTVLDDQARLHLTDVTGRYIVSTFAGEVPDIPNSFGRLWSYEPVGAATFDRQELRDTLTALNKVRVHDSPRVAAKISDNRCELSVDTGDGSSTRTISVDCPVEFNVAVNLRYLDEALAAFRGERVTVSFGTDRQPLMMAEDDLVVVVMPILESGLSRPPRRARTKVAA
jgi:hypothetical protein